jgi:hypothetical protein
MIRISVMDAVRRRRAIASLYRQTPTYRPLLRRPYSDLASEPDQFALAQLESYFRRLERRQPVW